MKVHKPLKLGISLALCLGFVGVASNPVAHAAFWNKKKSQTMSQCPAPASQCPTSVKTCPDTSMGDNNGISLAAQGVTPAIEGRVVNVDVFDNDSLGFTERVINNVVRRTPPEPGMTRAQVEASWGPSFTTALAPGKDVSIYVNNHELIDGRLMKRVINQKNLKVYEVTYADCKGDIPKGDAKVLTVKPVMMPRVGDHINMYSLLLDEPVRYAEGVAYFPIPASRIPYYRHLIQNPSQLVRVNTDAQGIVVAQEFLNGDLTGGEYVFTSADRYTPGVRNFQYRY